MKHLLHSSLPLGKPWALILESECQRRGHRARASYRCQWCRILVTLLHAMQARDKTLGLEHCALVAARELRW